MIWMNFVDEDSKEKKKTSLKARCNVLLIEFLSIDS